MKVNVFFLIDTQSIFKQVYLITFYPSARWARRGIVVPFVRRLRRSLTHSFGYYTNMVQQIEFNNSYKHSTPPDTFFYPRPKVKVKDLKKIMLTR